MLCASRLGKSSGTMLFSGTDPIKLPCEENRDMTSPVDTRTDQERITAVLSDLPILYEDDKEADLGESNVHVINDEILHICLSAHLKSRPEYRVFSNMNLYYQEM